MKILMVTMAMEIGGAETHILELSRELIRRGHSVTLASFGGVYADELAKCGVRNITLPLHTKHPARVLESYAGLKKLLREEKFDIVHAHARIPSFIVGLLNDSLTEDGVKFRFVTTAHLNFAVNPLWRKISRWGERVMAVSDDIADYLVTEYGCPRERIYTTINGIDTEKFSPGVDFSPVLEKHGLQRANRRIVYMSRLDPDRSEPAYRLMDVAPKIGERYPDAEILVVGGGTNFDELNGIAGRINEIAGRNLVTMTGAVSNTNEYCAASDVFVGVSRSALEAMSAGKAVIMAGGQGALGIFDESKASSAVDTNFCCRGFEPESSSRLYEEICALLDSEEKRQKLGGYNREFILKNYTASRMADDYLAMYGDALASPVCFKGAADVVVSGYYGFGNLGDESLLDTIASSAACEIPRIKIAALTRHPKADSRRTGLKCVSRFNFPAVFRELSRTKVLISGGGSLLQDKTSKRSLRYYAGVMRAAELFGKKVYVYANGIGPILHEPNKRRAARAVTAADAVSVRDEGSKEELVSLGVPAEKIEVSADPAFLISDRISEKAERSAEKRLGRLLGGGGGAFFAVSVRLMDVSSADCTHLTPRDEEILREVEKSAAHIAKRHKMTPVIIPMQESRDTAISEKLAEMLHSGGVEARIYAPSSAGELICVLRRASLLIGMRLHAIIFASSAGVPVVGLSYDPKVASFMRELGQKYTIDLSGDGISGTLESYADEIIENRIKIAGEINQVALLLKQKARKDVEKLRSMV